MAEEEIVIIEEEEGKKPETPVEEAAEHSEEEDGKKSKKKLFIIGGAAVGVVALIVTLVFIFFGGNKEEEKKEEENQTKAAAARPPKPPRMSKAEVERLIEKANAMYRSGDKEGALRLFNQISMFNESISNYNLGVAKMQENDCEAAIDYFKASIAAFDNEVPSAINAAVCSLKLGKKESFKNFLAIAKEKLPKFVNSPLYSFYYATINFYQGFYFESLAALKNPTSNIYSDQLNAIAPRVYNVFDDTGRMIEYLLKQNEKDFYSLGLLEARRKKYLEAIDYLDKARIGGYNPVLTNMATGLIYIKRGEIPLATDRIRDAYGRDANQSSSAYRIVVQLKESLFDINTIQARQIKNHLGKIENTYPLLFYYAQFKIFNPNRTISTIRKGSAGLLVNDVASAETYLKNAAKISKVNAEMTRGITYGLNGHTYLAYQVFKELAVRYPSHPVLEYDLALTLAQMGEYKEAYRHFNKSYNLDSKNQESAVFAIMCAKLAGVNFERIKVALNDDLPKDPKTEYEQLIYSLYGYTEGGTIVAKEWLDGADALIGDKNNPFYRMLSVLFAVYIKEPDVAMHHISKMLEPNPKELLPNIVALYAKYGDGDVKVFAQHAQELLNRTQFDFNPIFYGPDIAASSYINLARVAGLLPKVKSVLSSKLPGEKQDTKQLLKAMGLTLVYLQDFDEAFTTYQNLISGYDVNEPKQLFLAAIACIGSRHEAEAISFLELSKLSEPSNYEALFALGLLYLEAANTESTLSQFSKIGEKFISEYFDFNIAQE